MATQSAGRLATHESVANTLGHLQELLVGRYFGNERATRQSTEELTVWLSRISENAQQAGLTGLYNVVVRLEERILPLLERAPLSDELAARIEDWVQLALRYLNEPHLIERWRELIDFLNMPCWNDPLTEGHASMLNRLFEISRSQDMPQDMLQDAPVSCEARTTEIASEDSHKNADNKNSDSKNFDSSASTDKLSPQFSAEIVELVAMIRDELEVCSSALHESLEAASMAAVSGQAPSLEEYRAQVARLASAAESLGLSGLHEFLARVLETACLMESSLPAEVPQYCEILDRWPALASAYMRQLGGQLDDSKVSQALVDYIAGVEFPLPLDAADGQALLEKLRTPNLEAANPPAPARPATALSEHVSLAMPDDINQELLASLLHELPSQTQEFSAALQRVAASKGDAEDIRIAQRIAHTLKGSANTVGIRGIAELSHHLEDIFIALQDRGALPPKKLTRTLVDAADCLEAMSESLLGLAPAPQQALNVLQDVLDWANRIDREGFDGADAASGTAEPIEQVRVDTPISSVQAVSMASPQVETHEQMAAPAAEAAESAVVAPHSEASAAAPTLRVAIAHIDDLLRLSGESKIIGSQLKEGLRRVETQLHAVRRQNQLFQQLVNELEQLVDVRGISMPLMRRASGANSEFDALEMDQYSELHTVSRRLAEVSMDSREWSSAAQSELNSLEDLLSSQARQSNETQGSILKMRMVPATTIVSRLQRGVRQTCRLLDKEVELTIKGADTLVDSDSLNQLVDPLMHLMRNAIDHGIESADERVAKGKPSQGHLTVEFGRDGNQILVRCSDDGKGLDYAAIQATAESRGAISAGAALTEAQLARLILEPGFSTRSEVTQTSGRGIGLDIVHTRVLELKGTLDVQSQKDRGCRFAIRLPATLISTHALLVRYGKHTVAIASRGVRQILDSQAVKVAMLGNRLTAQVGDQAYEAHRIEALLGQQIERRENERAARPALLVEIAPDRICAILVQAVVDTIDLVVKPLGPFVPRSAGLVGATILGNGSVAPVMDIPDLLRVGARERVGLAASTGALLAAGGSKDRSAGKSALPSVLVVDDSLSVRRSMEQLLRDAGYDVRLARDGLEAVAILEAKKPDIMLVDLEMPRMNGMELTAHVRNRAETRDLPVIMITSRSTEKHRKQAEAAGVNHYMTKPYAEDVLLRHLEAALRRTA